MGRYIWLPGTDIDNVNLRVLLGLKYIHVLTHGRSRLLLGIGVNDKKNL